MTHPPVDDLPSLLALARRGDVHAFSRLMTEEQPRLQAQALAFCADLHLAQDLVQETMIAAWRSLSGFDGSCRLSTWLYVILLRQHHRSLGWFSRRLPLATFEQQMAAERHAASAPEDVRAAGLPEAELLQAMLSALPMRHREVVRLRYYAQASEPEIAVALGISLGTVKSRMHHAMEKLRRMKEKMNLLRAAGH